MAELLAVVGMMVLMMAFVGPVIRGLKGSRDTIDSAYEIGGILEQARTFAMANNTYTWVGFFEEDGVKPAVRGNVAATSGTGRVVACIFTAKDGLRYTPGVTPVPTQLSGSVGNLAVVGKIRLFEGMHLVTTAANRTIAPASMLGPLIIANTNGVEVVSTGTGSLPKAVYPLLATTPNYTFAKILEFNPLGEVNTLDRAVPGEPPLQWVGIGLQRANGNIPEAKPAPNIFIEGLTGRVHIFKP